VATRAGYDACREFRPLPEILVARLGDGHVEAIVQPVLQALENAPLLLERLAAVDLELPADHADDHAAAAPDQDSPLVEPASVRATDFDTIAFDVIADLEVVVAG
jgi:hypothetical protein